jgi:hypothetical protein
MNYLESDQEQIQKRLSVAQREQQRDRLLEVASRVQVTTLDSLARERLQADLANDLGNVWVQAEATERVEIAKELIRLVDIEFGL